VLVGAVALFAAPVSWLMPREAGEELSGHHRAVAAD
jgi:hypothetical protein